ncbi:MAG: hypothetical protein WBM86_23090 [Waterburya sp.]
MNVYVVSSASPFPSGWSVGRVCRLRCWWLGVPAPRVVALSLF